MKPVWRWTPKCVPSTADNDRRCYYLMATRGLKKPRGRTIALAFDEGVVGLVGRRAEPINGRCPKPPQFQIRSAGERGSFPILPRGADHSSAPAAGRAGGAAARTAPVRRKRRVFHGHRHADGWDLVTVAAQRHFRPVSPNARARAGGFARRGGGGRVAGQQPAFSRSGLPRVDAGHRQRARAPDPALEEAGAEFRRFSKRFAASSQKRARRSSIFILTC